MCRAQMQMSRFGDTMPASQDFRDGAATGAALVAARARKLHAWGVRVDGVTLDRLAEQVVADFGGRAHIGAEDV